MPRRGFVRESMRQEARAKAFEAQLEAWLQSYFAARARIVAGRAQGKVAKADSRPEALAARLRALVTRYASGEAARSASATLGVSVGSREVARRKDWLEWRDKVVDAMTERAERMLLQAATAEVKAGTTRGLDARVRRRASTIALGTRAALGTARNVTATAAQLGQEAGFDEAGVEVIEWQAFRQPIFDRRHDLLDGVMRKRGDTFDMPRSPHKLRWPHDVRGHVSETRNCRCTALPVLPGTAAWGRWEESQG